MHLFVELDDVIGDLLLGFDLCLAGEHFSFLLSVFIEVPDHALPAAICSTKHITVGCESFLFHLAAPFPNHQHYPRGFGYVQP